MKKNILILSTVFVLMLVVYLLVERPGTDIYRDRGKKSGPVFPDLKQDSVRAVEIKGSRYSVTLRKTDKEWMVDDGEGFPADEEAVESLLQDVAAMTYSEIASENKENHALFEVDDLKGVKVRLLDGKNQPLAAFIVGKFGQGPEISYIREDGANTVTLQKGLHRFRFDQPAQNWKDRTVMKFDPTKATGLEINRVVMSKVKEGEIAEVVGNERLLFVMSDGGWSMIEPEKKPARKTELDNILTILSGMKAAGIPDQKAAGAGLESPGIAAAVTMRDGTIHVMQVGNENPDRPNEFFARNADKPHVFSISAYQVSKLMEPVESLTQETKSGTSAGSVDENINNLDPGVLESAAPPR